MKSRDFFKNELIQKHGEPNNAQALKEYLDLVLNAKRNDNVYNEKHHILTQSQFPQYSEELWNIITMPYSDHINAHVLLSRSFNLMTYVYCLNMMKTTYRNHEEASNAAKEVWKNFRKSPGYEVWRRKRSLNQKKYVEENRQLMSDAQLKYWKNISEEEYEKRCERNTWTEERKKEWSKRKIEYSEKNREKLREIRRNYWANVDEDYKKKFNEKMRIVNSDSEKRKRAGESIKKKWKDPEFYEKMKKRRTWFVYVCISPQNEWHEFPSSHEAVTHFNFNKNLFRIFMNKNIQVPTPMKQANSERNQNTIGWKFFKFKKKEHSQYLELKNHESN